MNEIVFLNEIQIYRAIITYETLLISFGKQCTFGQTLARKIISDERNYDGITRLP